MGKYVVVMMALFCFALVLGGCGDNELRDKNDKKNKNDSARVVDKTLHILKLGVGSIPTNCYLVWDGETKETIIIDPGSEPDKIIKAIKSRHLKPTAVFITHGHWDHIGASLSIKNMAPHITVAGHNDDALMVMSPEMNFSAKSNRNVVGAPFQRLLKDGDELTLGKYKFKVIHVPGHSPGSICLYFAGNKEEAPVLFSGDVIFFNAIGRTDFPGCSAELLDKGIREKILVLPPETVVYPGHDKATTIKAERINNSFVEEEKK